jgi:hypothetical protein
MVADARLWLYFVVTEGAEQRDLFFGAPRY